MTETRPALEDNLRLLLQEFTAENVTRWMSFDEGRQYIEIDPAVAVPDLR